MTAAWAPRLGRGARLGFDHVRRVPVVLFPEGVLLLNDTARAVLEWCDGSRSIGEIVEGLAERYTDVREAEVLGLLGELADRGIVTGAVRG
ncbi:pyrroloquinoline quinone biosynthesis peptide chaperone PqqD [Actinokineospora sp. NBRC 105648]|uniref:pyrroloquinoline quinone biosynthesis peptide chaperone PqqD n=1 Tax=Actinokineospora sp. NBRC 105648 TaxID=3032206 RepID=UPI0024A22731|nr:pyrroloquinoline quinone biosynthesis peptide chaperone PqqD [Actinokineospora sp. NBRC 105648]GLZ43754.1 pyrroloquinoline quinone biosynthesis protein PqqD [Actinokineospora sp. NBRC 105648]